VLFKNNVDLTIQDADGCTALHIAKANVLKLLIDQKVDINALCKDGSTPLHKTVENGDTEGVKVLLENKASITLKNKAGKTVLQIAREKKFQDVEKLLVQYGAKE
jgi:ankyrin repeat protein